MRHQIIYFPQYVIYGCAKPGVLPVVAGFREIYLKENEQC